MTIWETNNITLVDNGGLFDFSRKQVDICVKSYFSKNNIQQTDVHRKSIDGNGQFNSILVFDIEYDEIEQQIVSCANDRKRDVLDRIFSGKKMQKNDPILFLEVVDDNFIAADEYIGQIQLDLRKLPLADGTSVDIFNAEKSATNPFEHYRKCKISNLPFTGNNLSKTQGTANITIECLGEKQIETRPIEKLPDPIRPSAYMNYCFEPIKYCCSRIDHLWCWIFLLLVLYFMIYAILEFPAIAIEKLWNSLLDDSLFENEDGISSEQMLNSLEKLGNLTERFNRRLLLSLAKKQGILQGNQTMVTTKL